MRPHALYQVLRSRQETPDTFTLTLAPQGTGFSFAPGQFTMLYVFGVGEVPISISGDPARPGELVHTIRAVGAVTRALGRLSRGDTVAVRGPFGSAWPVEAAAGQDVIVVAGGIGLAPLRPALYHLLAHRERYGRVALLYGARSPREVLYRPALERWRGRFDLQVEVTVDVGTPEWRGNVGVVTTLISRAAVSAEETMALICGPEVMIRFSALALQERGVAAERIYVSLERNMQCAVGYCGHCQCGPYLVCRDGPIFRYDAVAEWLARRDI